MPVPLDRAKANMFRALGHPARIRALELLLDGPQTVQQLLTRVGVEATNLSQQLTVLRQTGIVVSFRDRGLVAYRLRTPAVAVLLAAGQQMLHEILSDRDGLLTELETDQGGAPPGN